MPSDHDSNVLILASASPQRRQLLAEAGIACRVVPPRVDEPASQVASLPPVQQAQALAYFKARSVADLYPGAVVLGADTVVAAGGEVLGKPADAADARRMLETLSGSTHRVITGVAVLPGDERRIIGFEVTAVTMRPMTDAEMDEYVASGEWMDKAGGYAIQLSADRYVSSIEGSFSNVVGLPMELVQRLLARTAAVHCED